MSKTIDADCVVVGAGPVGLVAALALSAADLDTTIVGRAPAEPGEADAPPSAVVDTRTAALFSGSIAMLQRLGAWDAIADSCAELRAIRIVDATGELLRAPELMFTAAEIGRPEFGFNVPQAALSRGLWAAVRARPIRVVDGLVTRLATDADRRGGEALIGLSDGRSIGAALVVAADGRESACRTAAGISVRRWSYPQTAIATRFAHGRPHHGVSTEFHSHAGPCTTVPLPGSNSSLVWVERPETAERLIQMPDDAFLAELEQRLGGLLGTLSDLGGRRSFPLSGMVAETLGCKRVALVGEAGHVLPPIGAQGLNLGLFDVAVLADRVSRARRSGGDIGGPATLQAFVTARQADMARRMGAVDTVNRLLISQWLPWSLARGLGLHLLAASSTLRGRLIREGLQPADPLPALMQPAGVQRQAAN